VIIAIGVALRLMAIGFLAQTPLDGDALSYHQVALHIVGGTPFEPDWPPGVPALLVPAYAIFGGGDLVGRFVMLGVYLAFCGAVLKLGRRLGGTRPANLALAFFAVMPIFIWSSVNPLTQLPTATLAVGAVYFVDRCRKNENVVVSSLFLGLCLAGLVLTRPSNLAMAVALPLYLFWKKSRWQAVVVPFAVVVVLTTGWCWKAYTMTGHPVFINNANSQNVFYGNNPETPLYRTWWYGSHKAPGEMTPEFERLFGTILAVDMKHRDAMFAKVAMDHIRARPDLFVLRSVNRVRVFLGFDTFTSAQIATKSKLLGALVLALDASLYLALMFLALLFPLVVLSRAKGWVELMRSARRDGSAVPSEAEARRWGNDRTQTLYLLALVAFLYAAPYFFVFSHPTFHVPVTVLLGLTGTLAGVAFLETGIRPIWREAPLRARRFTGIALVFFLAIQVEWAVAVLERVGAG
jgi:4-amino-4-deoxy-L-arabinose transferase-like glycosyltransferase